MRNMHNLNSGIKSFLLVSTYFAAVTTYAVTIPNTPLVTQISAKPMVMLIAGKDHKLFYEAYNDASDIDGDGTLDIRFKPSIVYYGLFDSSVCYTHNGASDNGGLFTPSTAAGTLNKCSGSWSGNWLNYITTSRIDALRKVLYGGFREIDTETETILRRAYIPQDAHSWAKEYTSTTVDGYNIADYTPLSQPTSGKRHFFGNLTPVASTNCKVLSNCSDTAPWMSVVTNSGKRVWEWASTERPVLSDSTHGGVRTNYTVRAKVCSGTFTGGCKLYGTSSYKPVGLLHEYGENNAMLFGLLTGSYDKNMSGGLLRKVVSSFGDEVDGANGTFTSMAKIVKTFDNLRIRDFNNDRTDQAYKGGWQTTSAMTEKKFPDWGNPIGEMMYEGVRYFAGKASPTSDFTFTSTGSIDESVGLSSVAWDDPYSKTSSAKAPRCAKASFLTVSDINPSFDSDKVPGNSFGGFTGDITGLNATTEADTITANELTVAGLRFIGQSGSTYDSSPTPKTVSSLGNIRGLAPEEPTKEGSYYAAAVSYFAKRSDLRSDLTGKQNIDTYAVALASPLPRLEIKVPNGRVISMVPFAKSTGGASINAAKGQFQPTNQIVDFYVESVANSGTADVDTSVNGGRYYAKFRINFEDVEQGADHDMDAIVEYVIQANADSTLTVTLTPTYQAGGIQHAMGYIVSGTTKDGVYLVVQDEDVDRPYFLNVPPGKSPGYCDVSTMPSECKRLPRKAAAAATDKYSTIVFTPSTSTAASLLKDPLWYAAKWGGFNDYNNNSKPDQTTEWDTDNNGTPDTYFLVQNPLKLKEALKRAFDSISKINSSASNVIANSTSITTNSRIFQARFDANYWSGDLVAYPVSSSGVTTTVEWRASDRLPAPSARKLFIRKPSGSTSEFLWSNLDASDKALLDTDGSSTTDNSADVVDYLRGVRTKELKNGGSFRDRPTHVLGDIVHSSPFYVQDSDVIYVSGNDGMLHAFKASNGSVANSAGTELFGFIPAEVVSRLKDLTSTGYNHAFYVDGDITVSGKSSATGNKNYLFAALGRGGKGLFGLNVTSPSTFSASNFLWEYTPTASTAAASDTDLGYMLGRPVFAQMNDGSSALIIGNGYNSSSTKAVLYIFLLDTAGQITSIKKLDTGVAGDNGIGSVGVFDSDNNGTVDFIYAGDLKGNVWKFDVSAATPASWSVGLGGNPMFIAKDASNNRQPITAPISVVVDTVVGDTHEGKRFIFFGTGSYFRTGDPGDKSVQTWYGLIDDGSSTAISGRSVLRERTLSLSGTIAGSRVRSFSAAATGDMVGKMGWYLDFNSASPDDGERIITKSNLLQLIVPTLVVSSIVPNVSDPCISGGSGFINFMSPFKGGSSGKDLVDVDGNSAFDDKLTDSGGNKSPTDSVDLDVGLDSEPVLIGNQLCVGGTSETKPVACVKVNKGGKTSKGRISWREITKD